MVQGQYGLRARAVLGRRRRGELSAEDLQQPAAAATIGAGLQPGVMTKAERLVFGGRHAEYLEARCRLLGVSLCLGHGDVSLLQGLGTIARYYPSGSAHCCCLHTTFQTFLHMQEPCFGEME